MTVNVLLAHLSPGYPGCGVSCDAAGYLQPGPGPHHHGVSRFKPHTGHGINHQGRPQLHVTSHILSAAEVATLLWSSHLI